MRYMGWSYDQLLACPAHYIAVIAEISQREAVAARQRQARRR